MKGWRGGLSLPDMAAAYLRPKPRPFLIPVTGKENGSVGCGSDYAPMLALDFDCPGMYPGPAIERGQGFSALSS